jgi:CRP/FNR family cyclic AMP-dependent transcriptional regulator
MDRALLANIPLFAKLPPEHLDELAGMLRQKEFKNGDPIFWIGDSGTDFFIVQMGRVAITCHDEQGKEIVVATLDAGDFFGEISLLDGGPRTASARALSDCLVMSLNRADFMNFLNQRPMAAGYIVSVLGARQRDTLQKLRGVSNLNTVIAERTTTWQKIADTIAMVSASQPFVLLHLVWFGGWMLFNIIRGDKAPDPYPFGLLTMIVSLEAIFLSIFVLVSQNRSGEKDRIRADLDYQVNLKAQHEIMQLHQKLDLLTQAIEGATGAKPKPVDGDEAETLATDDRRG